MAITPISHGNTIHTTGMVTPIPTGSVVLPAALERAWKDEFQPHYVDSAVRSVSGGPGWESRATESLRTWTEERLAKINSAVIGSGIPIWVFVVIGIIIGYLLVR